MTARYRVQSEARRPEQAAPQPSIQSVYSVRAHLGFLLSRGKLGTEAFDADQRSLGIFPDSATAANEIERAARDVS
jgi:hypothetical protein